MKKYQVLYDIKSLETLIVRTFVNDMMVKNEKLKNFLTPTQVHIIEYIVDTKDDVYQKDLENVLNLRRATVSGVLQTMEKNQLIKRVPSNSDARVKKVILNPKTKELFLKHKHKMDETEKVVTKNIPESDLETFSHVLDMMKHNINEYLLSQSELVAFKKGDNN